MTRSISGSWRRAPLLFGAAVAGVLLSGCGAGQVAETVNKEPSVQGVNVKSANGEYAVRGLLVAYPGLDGYEAGDNAVLNAVLYNDSPNHVRVTVSTEDAREVVITDADPAAGIAAAPTEIPGATSSPGGTESPSLGASPTASVSPTPPGQPPRVEIQPLSHVQLNTEGRQVLQLLGLDESLRSGQNVFVTFDFGNGQKITAPAPVAVPLSPAAPPPPMIERGGSHEGQIEDGHGGEGGAGGRLTP
ncbi:hypothetical protein ACIA47_16020 [Micromonospora sp. NPDC051227]|uniref:hypothetical protein n=1 Tax=Micromonospora sp. NPDC051227 TaxID=3364285 RepID=UPI0037B30B75